MKRLTGFIRDRQVAEWCKRAAWIIAGIGIIDLAIDIYTQALLRFGDVGNPGNTLTPYVTWQLVRIALGNLPSIIFYFFVLYAAGAALNYFFSDEEEADEEEQDLMEEDLDENESVQPGQM